MLEIVRELASSPWLWVAVFLIAGLCMALCIGLAPLSTSVVATVALLCIAKAGTTVAASQVWALPGDVAPRNMTGTLAGLQNMVSNFGGVIGPIVTGFIYGATGSFSAAWIAAASSCSTPGSSSSRRS